MVSGASVLDQPVRYDRDRGARHRRRRRALYVAFTILVTGIVGLAVVEAAVGAHVYGIDTDTARASGNGTDVSVRFARVTRAQLSVSLQVTIHRTGGFEEAVTISISSAYLELFDANRMTPEPSTESNTESEVLMTFEPPPGEVFTVDWQMAARPIGWFVNRAGVISVVDKNQNPLVTARFHTDVRP